MKPQITLIQIAVLSLCVVSSFSIHCESKMKNNIYMSLHEVSDKIQHFEKDPTLESNNANLRSAISILNNSDFSRNESSLSNYNKYRITALKLHLKVVALFEFYYIENYKPDKPYYMNLMPPQDSVDTPVFGPVDPMQIKDKTVREKYMSDINENNKIGREISFQSELASLKNLLQTPDVQLGSIATVECFIKKYYTKDSVSEAEIKEVVGRSELSGNVKNRIIEDVTK